jgi:hypothetical protein
MNAPATLPSSLIATVLSPDTADTVKIRVCNVTGPNGVTVPTAGWFVMAFH